MNSVIVPTWRKSSFSSGEGNCVEVADWRKSTRSENSCVEVGSSADVAIRDTKLGEQSPILTVPAGAWKAFVTSL